jgi:L-threonylcarbamoyladenylate synthase
MTHSAQTVDNREVKTARLKIDRAHLQEDAAQRTLAEAAALLKAGALVAMPTETVYGLGANALDAEAVARIFEAKQRPAWDPIIVHVANEAMLADVVAEVPERARLLMQAFWPGPLTLLMPRSAQVPVIVTAGRALVGVRTPSDAVTLALVEAAGVPIAAPSANRFGHTSPTTAQHVLDDLDGRIDAVVDAGPTECGVESTVLDATVEPMIVYRPGAVTIEMLREVAGCAVESYREPQELESTPQEALPSPGVGLRHYAPKAQLILIEAPLGELDDALFAALKAELSAHQDTKIGLLVPAEVLDALREKLRQADAAILHPWGRWSHPEELAAELFAALRALDTQGCSVILAPLPPEQGIGTAVRDRMRKAASKAPVSR